MFVSTAYKDRAGSETVLVKGLHSVMARRVNFGKKNIDRCSPGRRFMVRLRHLAMDMISAAKLLPLPD